jgi:hypothetical protein
LESRVFGYTFLTVTNSLELEMNAAFVFRRLPNGVLCRSLSPSEAVEARAREEKRSRRLSPKEKAERAEARKIERLNEKRRINIGFANEDRYYTELSRNAAKEAETVTKLVKAEIGGSLSKYDITDIFRKTFLIDGVKVAGLEIRVLYEITADDDLGLETGTSDAIYYEIYRNPANPAKIEIRGGY